MSINDIGQQEALKRFHYVPKSERTCGVSESARREKQAHDRIELIKEARELGCDVEDLL